MYSSVSPGVGPTPPVSMATATLFWIAIDFGVSVWSFAVTSLTIAVGPSRPSMGVQLPSDRASLTLVASSPVVALSTGAVPASTRGT